MAKNIKKLKAGQMLRDSGLKDSQIKNILSASRNGTAQRFFLAMSLLKKLSLKEGDFLIKAYYIYDGDGERHIGYHETVSDTNSCPRKFQVVHIDEVGIPYIKRVLNNGELATELICLANIDPLYNAYELDPDYLDFIILSEESDKFEPSVHYKKQYEKK